MLSHGPLILSRRDSPPQRQPTHESLEASLAKRPCSARASILGFLKIFAVASVWAAVAAVTAVVVVVLGTVVMPPVPIDTTIFNLWRKAHGEPRAPGAHFRSHFFPGHTVAHRVRCTLMAPRAHACPTALFLPFLLKLQSVRGCIGKQENSNTHAFFAHRAPSSPVPAL